VRNQPHIRMDIDLPTLGRSYSRAFLPSMLKGKQRKERDTGYIYSGGVNTENATAFVQIMHRLARELYGFTSARSMHRTGYIAFIPGTPGSHFYGVGGQPQYSERELSVSSDSLIASPVSAVTFTVTWEPRTHIWW